MFTLFTFFKYFVKKQKLFENCGKKNHAKIPCCSGEAFLRAYIMKYYY